MRDLIIDADDTYVPMHARFVAAMDHPDAGSLELEGQSLSKAFSHLSRSELNERIFRFHLSTPPEELAPLPGALEGIEELASSFRLWVITARDESIARVLRTYNRHWGVDEWIPPERTVHVAQDRYRIVRSKYEESRRLGLNVAGVIEDKVHTARAFARRGVPVALVPYAWNAAYRDEMTNAERVIRPASLETAWLEIASAFMNGFAKDAPDGNQL